MLAHADYDGKMTAVNPAWTQVLGYTEHQLLTRPYADIIHTDDVGVTVDALLAIGRTGQPTRSENRIMASSGGWKPIGWTVSPEPDGIHFVEVLEENGYAPLEADDGASGLRILKCSAKIDLLITDVGLPGGMNGRQAADAAHTLRPELKVLFITGFAENSLVGNGHMEAGMEVITKPFDLTALTQKVRELLDR